MRQESSMSSKYFALPVRMTVNKLALATALCTPLFTQAVHAQAVGEDHLQLLDQYCSDCHNQDDFSGGLSFDLLDVDNVLTDAETWEKVLLKLEAGMMPPP